jgi:hypothetical protein
MKPESTPTVGVDIFVQGAANVDCVRLWFFGENWKEMVSPLAAWTVLGVKASLPPAPT